MIIGEQYLQQVDQFKDQRDTSQKSYRKKKISVVRMAQDKLLCPVELDIQINENLIIKERFDWNLQDMNISPTEYITLFSERLGLAEHTKDSLVNQLVEQLLDYVERMTKIKRKNEDDLELEKQQAYEKENKKFFLFEESYKQMLVEQEQLQQKQQEQQEQEQILQQIQIQQQEQLKQKQLQDEEDINKKQSTQKDNFEEKIDQENNEEESQSEVQEKKEERRGPGRRTRMQIQELQTEVRRTSRQQRLEEMKKSQISQNNALSKNYYRDKKICKICEFQNITPNNRCKKCKVPYELGEALDLDEECIRVAAQYYSGCVTYRPYLIEEFDNSQQDIDIENFASAYTLLWAFLERIKKIPEKKIKKIQQILQNKYIFILLRGHGNKKKLDQKNCSNKNWNNKRQKERKNYSNNKNYNNKKENNYQLKSNYKKNKDKKKDNKKKNKINRMGATMMTMIQILRMKILIVMEEMKRNKKKQQIKILKKVEVDHKKREGEKVYLKLNNQVLKFRMITKIKQMWKKKIIVEKVKIIMVILKIMIFLKWSKKIIMLKYTKKNLKIKKKKLIKKKVFQKMKYH